MGQPVSDNTLTSYIESSRYTKTTRGTETSKYPDSPSSGERKGSSPNRFFGIGVEDFQKEWMVSRMIWEGQSKKVITLYAKARNLGKDPEYHEAREISWEAGGTTLQG